MISENLSRRFLLVNVVFTASTIVIERVGISLGMYVYADTAFHIFDVPLIIIAYWVIIGQISWAVYRKFGSITGLVAGVIIDLPVEFLAFHLGWWT